MTTKTAPGPLSNNAKNALPIGTVLHLNGYSDPDYVIVKNLGVEEDHGYGVRYQTVSLETGRFAQHEAFGLAYLSEKQDNRIQLYITEEVKTPEECLNLWEKAAALQELEARQKSDAEQRRAALIEQGRAISARLGLESSPALIVAEKHQDESDVQTDYFNHITSQLVILAKSTHKRDIFSEMRKAAGKFEHTKHLGTGKGDFIAIVRIGQVFKDNGSWYSQGQKSHWHQELQGQDGKNFTTRAEAEAFIAASPKPEPISFGETVINFAWDICEREIEHREKWSMGDGYYLKAGHSDSTGWAVRKMRKYGDSWRDEVYISLAQVEILT